MGRKLSLTWYHPFSRPVRTPHSRAGIGLRRRAGSLRHFWLPDNGGPSVAPLPAPAGRARERMLPDHLPRRSRYRFPAPPALCHRSDRVLIRSWRSRAIRLSSHYFHYSEAPFALSRRAPAAFPARRDPAQAGSRVLFAETRLSPFSRPRRRHRIDPARVERMAFHDAPCRKHRSPDGAVLLQRFQRIGRTGRVEPAGGRLQRRDELAVKNDEGLQHMLHGRIPPSPADAPALPSASGGPAPSPPSSWHSRQ